MALRSLAGKTYQAVQGVQKIVITQAVPCQIPSDLASVPVARCSLQGHQERPQELFVTRAHRKDKASASEANVVAQRVPRVFLSRSRQPNGDVGGRPPSLASRVVCWDGGIVRRHACVSRVRRKMLTPMVVVPTCPASREAKVSHVTACALRRDTLCRRRLLSSTPGLAPKISSPG